MKNTLMTSSTFESALTWEQWESREKARRKASPIRYWIKDHIYYPALRLTRKIKRIPKEVKWFLQRGKRGWADCDAWETCDYLARIIPEMLDRLQRNKQGVPIPRWFKANRNMTNSEFKRAQKEWSTTLQSMITGFKLAKNRSDWGADRPEDNKKIKLAFDLFHTHYYDLWD